MAVMVLETIRSAAELKFLGMLGPEAMDTVITVNQTFSQLFMTFVIATAWGGSALVAQRVGARDVEEAGRTMGQCLGLMLGVGLLAALVANAASSALLGGVGMDAAAQARAVMYLRLIGLVAMLSFVSFGLNSTLQATGDVLTPLYMVVIGTGTHTLLAWLFIFGVGPLPALGPVGVVVASAGASFAALSIAVYRVRMLHGDLGLHLRSLIVRDWSLFGRIVRLSWPVWLQILCRAVGIILIIRLAGRYGAMARAGYGVALRVDMMLIGVGMAFTGAAATIAGQNKGAGLLSRAAKGPWVAWLYYTGVLLCFTVLFWLRGEAVVGLFTDEPAVIEVGAAFLRITSAVYPFFTAAFVFSRAQQGAGDMWTPTWITLVITFGVFMPLALWLPGATGLGVRGVFLSSAISMIVAGFLQTGYFLRGGWRTLET